jgi:trehalose 6-phosphate synthase/phosphatase
MAIMDIDGLEYGRLIIVSNRLPFTVSMDEDELKFGDSSGGLVTGISTFLDSYKYHFPRREDHIWLGWPGGSVPEEFKEPVQREALSQCGAYPVFLSAKEMEQFYWGFCNNTLWPLFHYFPSYAVYEEEFWQTYRRVNEKFRDALLGFVQPNDIVWIQDYHLMLLPRLLREKAPQIQVGFFLHIPFPSFEIFRLLPPRWRSDILKGILGADLVGFHTYEYMQHFLHSVLLILGYEHHMGSFSLPDHMAKVETYPMGIDFQKFFETSTSPETQQERTHLQKILSGFRTALSVDRLDYTKGILHRLEGYELFLEKYPEYRGKLILIMVVVPSRIGVRHYELMKGQIEERIGRINGKYGSIEWTPIIYQYRRLTLHPLSALYSMSDIALVTPLRDGMNLIAKEYVASRTDRTGILILSEMAGAAKELGEAIIINPNDYGELADALKEALEMPREEQERRNTIMQERLRRYDVVRWASDFVSQLAQMKEIQQQYSAKMLPPAARKRVAEDYARAKRRLLFIDYDGTLVSFERRPLLAAPTETVLDILKGLTADTRNTIVLTSGRDKPTLEQWFGDIPMGIVAEHGVWLREKGCEWLTIGPHSRSWKSSLIPVLLQYADRLPGAFVEEKEFSLAWHYRAADPQHSSPIAAELMDNLVNFTANIDVQVFQENKVLEVRYAGVNKGSAAKYWISRSSYDFMLAIGDDWADEDLFQCLPANAHTLRVGLSKTCAEFNLRDPDDVCEFLRLLTGLSHVPGVTPGDA